jgi:NAD(P)-dependent dehydrogenase (short-subunit alcohol dehydrogenase family)
MVLPPAAVTALEVFADAPNALVFSTFLLVILALVGKFLINPLWLLLLGVLAFWGFEAFNFKLYQQRRKTVRGAVLITGASSGIGKDAALSLYGTGLDIYAAVRKPEDAEALQKEAKLLRSGNSTGKFVTIFLDVTKPDQIKAAYDQIAAEVGNKGLLALVNNSGIGEGGPVEVPLDSTRKVIEVNVFGCLAVLQAFMPLLRLADKAGQSPRVIWISSVSGAIATPLTSAYAMSKHALEAAQNSFHREVSWTTKIRSISIQPAEVITPIWDKGLQAAASLATMTPEQQARWKPAYEASAKWMQHSMKFGVPVSQVSGLIDHAIFAPYPNRSYVTSNARLPHILATLPLVVVDYAAKQTFGIPAKEAY